MKIWALTKIGLKECLRQRVIYFIFLLSLLFVLMAKGCDIGTIKGENLLIDKEQSQGITFGISFYGIVFWSIMLCGLLASQALTRDMDEGFASATLARPLGRDAYIAGKLLPVIIISTLNLTVLGGLFCWFFYRATGGITMRIPLSFLFMTPSLALYGLMVLCLALFIPRLLAPLAGIAVYMISCWSSLPYSIESLKLLWTPSATVQRLHLLLPKFGDLQCIGAAILSGQQPFVSVNPLAVLGNLAAYVSVFWYVTVWVFKRRDL
jgi:ABC-type transport system involved in multi-copper enzyme maturation permease subunit